MSFWTNEVKLYILYDTPDNLSQGLKITDLIWLFASFLSLLFLPSVMLLSFSLTEVVLQNTKAMQQLLSPTLSTISLPRCQPVTLKEFFSGMCVEAAAYVTTLNPAPHSMEEVVANQHSDLCSDVSLESFVEALICSVTIPPALCSKKTTKHRLRRQDLFAVRRFLKELAS